MGVYDKFEDGGVLKIGAYDGRSEVGTGVLGVFNISKEEISFALPVTKFPGVNAEDNSPQKQWIVRSHMSRRLSRPITPKIPVEPGSLLQATLPERGYDVWSAVPVHDFDLHSGHICIAVLGLLEKMTGACAIVESSFTVSENGSRLKCHVSLKALGRLGIWVSDGSTRKVEDLMVTIKGQVIPSETVSIDTDHADGDESGVVVIDVEKAWDELKVDAGWSNEVPIEVSLG